LMSVILLTLHNLVSFRVQSGGFENALSCC
jgi:hypothetical protein